MKTQRWSLSLWLFFFSPLKMDSRMYGYAPCGTLRGIMWWVLFKWKFFKGWSFLPILSFNISIIAAPFSVTALKSHQYVLLLHDIIPHLISLVILNANMWLVSLILDQEEISNKLTDSLENNSDKIIKSQDTVFLGTQRRACSRLPHLPGCLLTPRFTMANSSVSHLSQVVRPIKVYNGVIQHILNVDDFIFSQFFCAFNIPTNHDIMGRILSGQSLSLRRRDLLHEFLV